jgi:hypothetical protein
VAEILYKEIYKEIDPALENGYMVYIKPAVLASDDPDVTAYKAANPAFPHESTGNQWFNESQTESYRDARPAQCARDLQAALGLAAGI